MAGRASKVYCCVLALLSAVTLTGCIDLLEDGAKSAFTDLTEATVETLAIVVIERLVPGFEAPPPTRTGLTTLP